MRMYQTLQFQVIKLSATTKKKALVTVDQLTLLWVRWVQWASNGHFCPSRFPTTTKPVPRCCPTSPRTSQASPPASTPASACVDSSCWSTRRTPRHPLWPPLHFEYAHTIHRFSVHVEDIYILHMVQRFLSLIICSSVEYTTLVVEYNYSKNSLSLLQFKVSVVKRTMVVNMHIKPDIAECGDLTLNESLI